MLRFLADENFNQHVVRGLLAREPNLDIVRVQEVGLSSAADPAILEWAANENRILLTQDVRTVTHFAYVRVRNGLKMPGVVEVNPFRRIGERVDAIRLLALASFDGE